MLSASNATALKDHQCHRVVVEPMSALYIHDAPRRGRPSLEEVEPVTNFVPVFGQLIKEPPAAP